MCHTLSYFHALYIYVSLCWKPSTSSPHCILLDSYLCIKIPLESNLLWEVFHIDMWKKRSSVMQSTLCFLHWNPPLLTLLIFFLTILSLFDLIWCPFLNGSLTLFSLEHPIHVHKTLLYFNDTLFLCSYCLSPPTPTRL